MYVLYCLYLKIHISHIFSLPVSLKQNKTSPEYNSMQKDPMWERTLEMTSTLMDHKHESKLRSMRFHYHPISFPRAELEMGKRWIVSLPIPADPREPYMRVSELARVSRSYLHPLPMNRFFSTTRKVSTSSCTIATIIVVNMPASRCRVTGDSQTTFNNFLGGMCRLLF